MRRSLRILQAATLLAATVVLVPAAASGTRVDAADACALVTRSEAIAVIGSSEASLAEPLVVRPGTCNWHSTDSGCTLRVLSVEVTRGSAARHLAAVRAEADAWSGAPGIGDDGFYTADALPAGSAVFIEHLHLRRGDTMAVLTLLGRIGPDASHDLLARVGTAVASRL